MRSVCCWVELLSGPEGAVGWLVEMSLMVTVVVFSKGGAGGWWALLAVGGVGALGAVENGVVGNVVSCCLLDAVVGSMVELAGSEGGRGSRWCWLEIPVVAG